MRITAALIFSLISSSLSAAEPIDYLRDIKPIFAKSCIGCHGPQKERGGLRLDTAELLLKGGNSGTVVEPGKSSDSLLIHAVTGTNGVLLMPEKGTKLSDKEIALLRTWIDQGARPPKSELTQTATTSAKQRHWSLVAPVRPAEPPVRNSAWVRNPIDRFILAQLEKEGLAPSDPADRVTLIRRLSFDLLGLPPSIAEVDEFVNDKRPDAYEQLVERLLASPHYGERWGRHWLDAARYADSNGFNKDGARQIWKYRDWVINAFNRDMPFDQFTIEQLAGDMLPNATLDQKVASGFHRNTTLNLEGGVDKEEYRVESVVDRVNTTGSVFLGLTIGCCQCHDHKYDPISQREFYQLFAFFNNADEPQLEIAPPELIQKRNANREKVKQLEAELKKLEAGAGAQLVEWEKKLTAAERSKFGETLAVAISVRAEKRTESARRIVMLEFRKTLPAAVALLKQIDEVNKSNPAIPFTLVMEERKEPRQTFIHIKGDFTRKGVPVVPGVPVALHPLSESAASLLSSGKRLNRLDFAHWLIDLRNPLTARVTMNRVWQNYFGLGLVETENDFGTQGARPSHPELLDWLAVEFPKRGWRLKEMHRLIVTSATYRQASRNRADLATRDPRNRLLGRQNRLRLEAEIVRDAALAASGLLQSQIGGPSVFPPQPEGLFSFTQLAGQYWKTTNGPDRFRRGMYTHFWRSAPYPALSVFDAPESTTTCTRRMRSNTPLQALTLLNDLAYFECAQGLAKRILAESQGNDQERIRLAFRLCLSREPKPHELQRLSQLLKQEQTGTVEVASLNGAPKVPPTSANNFNAWVAVSRALLNLDEFITRE